MDALTASHRLERSRAGRKPLLAIFDIMKNNKSGRAAEKTQVKLLSYDQELPVPGIDGAGRSVCSRAVASATRAGS